MEKEYGRKGRGVLALGDPLSVGQKLVDNGFIGGQTLSLFELFEHLATVGQVYGLIGPELLHFSKDGMIAVQDRYVA